MARQTFVVGETVWVYRWGTKWVEATVTQPDIVDLYGHRVEVAMPVGYTQPLWTIVNTRRYILNDAEYQVLHADVVAKRAAAQAETERLRAAWETAMRSHAEYLVGLARRETGVRWGEVNDKVQQHLDCYFTLNSAGREWAKARTAEQEEAPK